MATKTKKLKPIQMHLLKMFNYTHTKKNLEELKDLLSKHFADKVDEEMDEIWVSKNLSQTKLKKMANEQRRISYKK